MKNQNKFCDLLDGVDIAINTTALAARRALLFGTSNTLPERAKASTVITRTGERCVAKSVDSKASITLMNETIMSNDIAHNKHTCCVKEKERQHDIIHVEPHVDA